MLILRIPDIFLKNRYCREMCVLGGVNPGASAPAKNRQILQNSIKETIHHNKTDTLAGGVRKIIINNQYIIQNSPLNGTTGARL